MRKHKASYWFDWHCCHAHPGKIDCTIQGDEQETWFPLFKNAWHMCSPCNWDWGSDHGPRGCWFVSEHGQKKYSVFKNLSIINVVCLCVNIRHFYIKCVLNLKNSTQTTFNCKQLILFYQKCILFYANWYILVYTVYTYILKHSYSL